MDQRLPVPLTLQDAAGKPDRFIEERARNSLKKLTSVGARPAGNYLYNKRVRPTKNEPQLQGISYLEREKEWMREGVDEREGEGGGQVSRQAYLRIG